ncbi:hypothetical protein BV22DRAFT_715165 [Leucogyrophana mollusca]|uniref:Uncharacterized protein n=1 Tax=Leucogyrophana mollusca TaxID=85980 RepID=A0ACB8B8U0_9AGAM|nr:hypothetical protein BV22DRAFT_715165 [Leucogyrophana mollusca]
MPKITEEFRREFYRRPHTPHGVNIHPSNPALGHGCVWGPCGEEPVYFTDENPRLKWVFDGPNIPSPSPPACGTGYSPDVCTAGGFDPRLLRDCHATCHHRRSHTEQAPPFPIPIIPSTAESDVHGPHGYTAPSNHRLKHSDHFIPAQAQDAISRGLKAGQVDVPVIPVHWHVDSECTCKHGIPLSAPRARRHIPVSSFVSGKATHSTSNSASGSPMNSTACTPPEEIFTIQTDPTADVRFDPPHAYAYDCRLGQAPMQRDSESSTYSLLRFPSPHIPGLSMNVKHNPERHVVCNQFCSSPSPIRLTDRLRAAGQADQISHGSDHQNTSDRSESSFGVAINVIPPTNSTLDSGSGPKSLPGSGQQSDDEDDSTGVPSSATPRLSARPATPRPRVEPTTPPNPTSGFLAPPTPTSVCHSSTSTAVASGSEYTRSPASQGLSPLSTNSGDLSPASITTSGGLSSLTTVNGYLASSEDEQGLSPLGITKATYPGHRQHEKEAAPAGLRRSTTRNRKEYPVRSTGYDAQGPRSAHSEEVDVEKAPKRPNLIALIRECIASTNQIHVHVQGRPLKEEAVGAMRDALDTALESVLNCKESEVDEEDWRWRDRHEDALDSLHRTLPKIHALSLEHAAVESERVYAYERRIRSLAEKLDKSHSRLSRQHLHARLRRERSAAREEIRQEEIRRAAFKAKWEEGKATRAELRREMAIAEMGKDSEIQRERVGRDWGRGGRGKGAL